MSGHHPPGHAKSWRDYLPLPHLVAKDVHVGNPAGMRAQAEMASVAKATVVGRMRKRVIANR